MLGRRGEVALTRTDTDALQRPEFPPGVVMRLYQSLLGRPPHGGPTFMCPPLIVAVGVIRDLEVVRGAPTPIGHVIVDPCGSQADSAGAVDVDRDDLGLLVGKA